MIQAVILVGGLGTRLRPITKSIPKPLVPILGRSYLEYQIEYLVDVGIVNILILTGYLGSQIQDHFKDGSEYGVSIVYSQENEPLGTGGALVYAKDKLEDDFLVLYGDSFLPVDYTSLVNTFKKLGKKCLIAAYDNSIKTSVGNNLFVDRFGYVKSYEKNSNNSNLNYVDAGVLVCKKKILSSISSPASLEEDIFPKIIQEEEMVAYKTTERFYDIGTPERLVEATQYFKTWQSKRKK